MLGIRFKLAAAAALALVATQARAQGPSQGVAVIPFATTGMPDAVGRLAASKCADDPMLSKCFNPVSSGAVDEAIRSVGGVKGLGVQTAASHLFARQTGAHALITGKVEKVSDTFFVLTVRLVWVDPFHPRGKPQEVAAETSQFTALTKLDGAVRPCIRKVCLEWMRVQASYTTPPPAPFEADKGSFVVVNDGKLTRIDAATGKGTVFARGNWSKARCLARVGSNLYMFDGAKLFWIAASGKYGAFSQAGWQFARALAGVGKSLCTVTKSNMYRIDATHGTYAKIGHGWTKRILTAGGKRWLWAVYGKGLYRISPTNGRSSRVGKDSWAGAVALASGPRFGVFGVVGTTLFRLDARTGARKPIGNAKWTHVRALVPLHHNVYVVSGGKLWRVSKASGRSELFGRLGGITAAIR